MVKYGDYFSRKTLYRVGISPDETLSIQAESAYDSENRREKILGDMKGVYQTFVNARTAQKTGEYSNLLKELNIERKIVSAFYDLGVLSGAERDYYWGQSLSNEPLREQISVEEADFVSTAEKSQAVSQGAKNLERENVRK